MNRTHRAWGAVAIAMAALVSTAHADDRDVAPSEVAQASEAATVFERAQAAYAAGNFAAAIGDFKKAFELDPKSDYLFGWAQSLRRSGDCPGALVQYRRLLAMPLAEDQAAATRQAMSRCPSEPVAVTPTRESEPWYRDWTAHAFAGGGAIALGVGSWATIASVGDERDAREAETYGEHERLTRRAKVLRVVGISGLAVGAIAATIGVVMYTRGGDEESVVTGWVDRESGGVVARFAW
jgi:tetratricopeptide (TPR) repeat protein